MASAVRAEVARPGRKTSELVEVLGLSRPTVSGRLNGVYPFTVAELDKLVKFLGISPQDLIDSIAISTRIASVNEQQERTIEDLLPPEDSWAQPPRSRRRRRSY